MEKIVQEIEQFINERDWKQFHTPDCLAKSISIEAGELLECFQWDSNNYNREHVLEELADVMIYAMQMAIALNVNPEEIMRSKMLKNAKKYPVDKAKGNSSKYTEL
ncbi:nucleotide pyrophosphohydrolase [Anaerorhabdus sp.]|uniref:nucleotide pyrophosphohydrolase n=1 Tax=Anaerorhabdus sp. TaxID=1872524 RepID=UPI002B1F6185|nr:nucleotide pyrophosphohydrolase [Anaerorhabdus sp.]MEA4876136.1 nucleotide pyrophosphohydrolase [Anaerorhabdus sp.]